MDAESLVARSYDLGESVEAHLVIWRLPRRLPGSEHPFKYRLALIVDDECVLRYDNEAGKGDHRHIGRRQVPYSFVDLDELQADFWEDVNEWLSGKRKS